MKKTLNERIEEYASIMKEQGAYSEAGQEAWNEIVKIIPRIATGKIIKYANKFNIFLDVDDIISRVSFEGVLQQLKRWDKERGTFKNLLLYNVDTQLKDARKKASGAKYKSLAHSVSLDGFKYDDPSSDSVTVMSHIASDELTPEEIVCDPVEELLANYAEEKGQAHADVVRAIIFITDNTSQKEAFLEALEADEYTPSLRVKVARIKQDFKYFCDKNGVAC